MRLKLIIWFIVGSLCQAATAFAAASGQTTLAMALFFSAVTAQGAAFFTLVHLYDYGRIGAALEPAQIKRSSYE